MAAQHARWRKSSYSTPDGDCVECADFGNSVIGIRDSKAPATGHLAVGRQALAALISEIKAGELDLRSSICMTPAMNGCVR